MKSILSKFQIPMLSFGKSHDKLRKPQVFSPLFPRVFWEFCPHGFSHGHLGGDAGAQVHGFVHVAQNLLQLTSGQDWRGRMYDVHYAYVNICTYVHIYNDDMAMIYDII